ncbi:MAG: tetratricopeptide repeat protein [Bacteroidia bacterium]|nr:tetratricopeptide repeat protein [Bacteroidia bacterium]
MSKQLKNKGCYFLFALLFATFGLISQNPQIDSLKKLLPNTKDTSHLIVLSQLVDNIEEQNEWELYNEKMGQYAFQLFNTKNNAYKIMAAKYIGDYYSNLGYCGQLRNNSKSAFANYNKSLKIKEILNDKPGLSVTLSNMGLLLAEEGNYSLAVEYLYRSLRIAETIKFSEGVLNAYNALANTFYYQKDFEKAIEFYRKSMSMSGKEGFELELAGTYNNLGSVFDDIGQYDSSLYYFNKCIELTRPTQNYYGLASIYNNIGMVNTLLKNYDVAQSALDSSTKYSTIIGSPEGLATSYHNKAQIFYEKKQLKEAMHYSSLEEKYAAQTNSPKIMSNASLLAYRLNKLSGNYKKAMEYHETYLLMKDSLESEQNKKAVLKSQFKYDYEKKAIADSLKTQEEQKIKNLKHEEEISKQRTYTYGGIVGFLLMMVVAIVAVKAYKQKQKANEIITAQKNEVEKQKSIIEEQKEIVEEHQKEIIDSIRYAKRIQQALLPTQKYIAKSIDRLKK